ncbi:MAG: segregation/condensation protein A [Thermoanaerobaculum sp.]|nr:segregation/condensation protein A [Thermoanaerobaculum sp.]
MGAVALGEAKGPAVHLPVFQGPLDLLLFLVQENKVSIWDIPVATICDQYQAWLRTMEELDLVVAAEYLVCAAWLLAIKSRMLLPRRSKDEPDPRAELVERLLAYEKVKRQAAELAGLLSLREGVFSVRLSPVESSGEPELALEELDVGALAQAMGEVLQRFRREHPPGLVLAPLGCSVQEKMRELLGFLSSQGSFPLLSHMLTRRERVEAVTCLLAALELVWLGAARVHQQRSFAEIYLVSTGEPVAVERALGYA